MEVSKLVDIRREVMNSSLLLVLHTDVNVLVELIHNLEELFYLFSFLHVVQFGLLSGFTHDGF